MDKYALIGYPLSHSYSPLIHNEVFKNAKIDAHYDLLETKPDDLGDVIKLLKNGTYKGFNVTIPYKIKVMSYLDEISPEALAIGSVNTIAVIDGKLIGYNTDYYGFKKELEYVGINPEYKRTYVLGTGGASLAIFKALKDLKSDVVRVSRSVHEDTVTYDYLDKACDIDLIVNTTPVGMYPNTSESPIKESTAKKAGSIVDIIFNPSVTKLMSYNKNSFNGLLMLIFQALKAEEIWFKKPICNNEKELIETVRGELNE